MTSIVRCLTFDFSEVFNRDCENTCFENRKKAIISIPSKTKIDIQILPPCEHWWCAFERETILQTWIFVSILDWMTTPVSSSYSYIIGSQKTNFFFFPFSEWTIFTCTSILMIMLNHSSPSQNCLHCIVLCLLISVVWIKMTTILRKLKQHHCKFTIRMVWKQGFSVM